MKHESRITNKGLRIRLLVVSCSLLVVSLALPAQAAAVIGKFPSLLGSDGARAVDTDIVWLGEARDKENNSKQTDMDNDDGVSVEFNSCAASRAHFLVHLKKPGKTGGMAYLNLWADWNRDGRWAGSDKCAPEWAVKNYEIDLSKQTDDIWVYVPEFTSGKIIKDIWYRAVVSYNEKLTREDGGGEFAAGEVEDYGPLPILSSQKDIIGGLRRGAKDYGLACVPQPIFLNHGQSAEFTVVPDLKEAEKPVSTGFSPKNPGLNAGGTSVNSSQGDVTKKPKNPNQFGDPNNPFVYTSKEVHDIGATTRDSVIIQAAYADGKTSEVVCMVFIWHPPPELPGGPVPQTPPAPEEDRGPIFKDPALLELWKKIKGEEVVSPEPPVSPPKHNIVLSALQDGVGWVKKTGGKIIDGLTGGGKPAPPTPPAPVPPVAPPQKPEEPVPPKKHNIVLSALQDGVGWVKKTGGKIIDGLTGGDTQKQIIPPSVPPTETLNVWQRAVDYVREGNIFNIPPVFQMIGFEVDNDRIGPAVSRIGESIKRGIICLSKDPACDDGNADSSEIAQRAPEPGPVSFTNARRLRDLIFGSAKPEIDEVGFIDTFGSVKSVEIILPVPELVIALPSPTKELEKITPIISPFNFLSQRLIDLGGALQRLVVPTTPTPAPVAKPDITKTNPRCFAFVQEDTGPDNVYKYEAACRNYKSCSVTIRNLTSQGGLVFEKKISLPAGGEITAKDVIPTLAAIAEISATCDGTTHTAFAHNYISGKTVTPSAAATVADLVITTTSVPNKTLGTPSSDTISATGGTTPYTWSISNPSVACSVNNYAINSGTGVLTSNNAGGAGTCTLTINVEDSQSPVDTDTQDLSFDINP